MKRSAVLRIAATALVAGTTLIGANPAVKQIGFASASDETDGVASAAEAAAAASQALKGRDFETAITAAERAVGMSPREASYRTLLGQAYLQGGRLVSAETAFGDALTLDPANGRATLSLALVQIALGKHDLALTTLRGAQGPIAEADRGLAYALAGETITAIEVLEAAARAPGVSPKTRQNLGLAYALAGNWNKARAVAAQDMAPGEVNQRVLSWVRFSQPENSWDQVATLLGIAPIEDAGQPIRLALGAEPMPAPMSAPEVGYAAVEPEALAEPIKVAVTDGAGVREITFGPRQEIVQPIPASYAPAAKQLAAAQPARVARGVESGRYVVQIGAYSSASRAAAAWHSSVGRFGELSSYRPVGDTYSFNGAAVHRVALGGFNTRAEAMHMCERVKAKGGSCFVRASGAGAPSQWVQRATQRVASR